MRPYFSGGMTTLTLPVIPGEPCETRNPGAFSRDKRKSQHAFVLGLRPPAFRLPQSDAQTPRVFLVVAEGAELLWLWMLTEVEAEM